MIVSRPYELLTLLPGPDFPGGGQIITPFDDILAVDLLGVFLCMKYQIRQMLTQGGGVGGDFVDVDRVGEPQELLRTGDLLHLDLRAGRVPPPRAGQRPKRRRDGARPSRYAACSLRLTVSSVSAK